MGANLFQQYLQPPKSVVDFSNDMEMANARRNQNALQSLTLQQQAAATQQSLQERNALQRIAAASGGDRNALISGLRNSGLPGLMTQADSLEQSGAKLAESQSVAGKNNAETAAKDYDLRLQKANKAISDIAALNSPEDAIASVRQHLQAGDIDMGKATAVLNTIPKDPAQFPAWRKNMLLNILDAKTQLEVTKPVLGSSNLGGSEVFTARDPLTGAVTVNGSQARTVSPDTIANNATHIQGIKLQQAGENTRAGVNPGGGLDDNSERTAQAIANGQLPAPTGMALLNPKNQRILGRVMEINPKYDFTDVTAKKAAAQAFTTGSQGNALRAVSTANAHLDQLGDLVDAMNNGNTQVLNKVANYFVTATGDPKVTNFDAIKNVVGQEVVKAIVAGGGSAGERDEAAKAFANEKSPDQLKGAIQHYRMVMKAQADNLKEQRRAAGLKDETMPNYQTGSGGKVVSFGDLK